MHWVDIFYWCVFHRFALLFCVQNSGRLSHIVLSKETNMFSWYYYIGRGTSSLFLPIAVWFSTGWEYTAVYLITFLLMDNNLASSFPPITDIIAIHFCQHVKNLYEHIFSLYTWNQNENEFECVIYILVWTLMNGFPKCLYTPH